MLKGQVCIITGAGSGLGKALALRFAEEGAKLLLPDIILENAEITAKEIRDKGGEAVAIKTDISDENATKVMAEKVIQIYGGVDILLNNAAMIYGVENKPWDTRTVEEWDAMFVVNVRGTWLCCKAIASLMAKQGKGKIINISSSIMKDNPYAYLQMPYACTKAAIKTMTELLARALGPSGINVNAIAPGLTVTESNSRVTKEEWEAVAAAQCIHRSEQPSDLVGAAVFLASRDSDFITGQIIPVNGGSWLL